MRGLPAPRALQSAEGWSVHSLCYRSHNQAGTAALTACLRVSSALTAWSQNAWSASSPGAAECRGLVSATDCCSGTEVLMSCGHVAQRCQRGPRTRGPAPLALRGAWAVSGKASATDSDQAWLGSSRASPALTAWSRSAWSATSPGAAGHRQASADSPNAGLLMRNGAFRVCPQLVRSPCMIRLGHMRGQGGGCLPAERACACTAGVDP